MSLFFLTALGRRLLSIVQTNGNAVALTFVPGTWSWGLGRYFCAGGAIFCAWHFVPTLLFAVALVSFAACVILRRLASHRPAGVSGLPDEGRDGILAHLR
jgi:hypothetical protein